MQSQTTNTRAKTLGPFLTLILLSSARRGRASSQALRSAPAERPTSEYVPFATTQETLHGSRPAARPLELGPILTLILTVKRSQPEGLPGLAVKV